MPPAEVDVVRCRGCGAIQREPDARFCSYCGAKFAPPEPPAMSAESSAPSPRERLRWLESQADRAARFGKPSARIDERKRELTRYDRVYLGCGIAIVVVALWFLTPFLTVEHPALLMYAVVPLAFALLGAFLAYRSVRRMREVALELRPSFAAIADKRTHVETRNDRARTTYFATLEFSDGNRVELETTGDLYGALCSGDVGVAWRNPRGTVRLLDFRVLQPV